MRRLRRILVLTTAVLVAAVVLYAAITLPPAAIRLDSAPATTVFGAYHVHTNRSDGSGTMADVAAAAAQSDLQFVIVTDHGDATRTPEPPQYLSGVLVIDAVEISTMSGHLVALGLKGASAFPLGVEARDTVEDIHRMGGWAIAAHPDSPHAGLSWRGDDTLLDGIEWLNADSEWRDEGTWRLAQAVGHYLLRPSESIASIFDRPAATLRRWDALAKGKDVVGLAGVDAHAKIGIDEDSQATESRTVLARPSYRDMFRTVAQAVNLDAPLTGDASRDAAVLLQALRTGRSYSVVRAIASPGEIEFSATDGRRRVGIGASLETSGPVAISASVPAPANATVVLFRDGEEVARGVGSATFKTSGASGAFRAEVSLPSASVPWIVTNAIRLGPSPIAVRESRGVPQLIRRLDDAAAWAAEKEPASRSDISASSGEVAMAFQLAPGPNQGQFAAMAYPLPGGEEFESVTVTLRSSAPMRVSMQLRQPSGRDGFRWVRSIFVDETPREVTVPLQDFHLPADSRPTATLLRTLMFVVDDWHTKPGTAGTLWVSGLSIGGAVPGVKSAR
jgi:hypothetical protein